MRRLRRTILCTLEVALAIVALSAICLWIWGYRHPMNVVVRRFPVGSDHVDRIEWVVCCAQGRLGIGKYHGTWFGSQLREAREEIEQQRDGWAWEPGLELWPLDDEFQSRGPIGWGDRKSLYQTSTLRWRCVWVSCWLLALIAAAWPLASFALFVRRRRQAAHAGSAVLCPACGYDLRATPERCPECGRKTADQASP